MEINWKVSAVFAGAAFILSILSGAIAGVGFGLLLLRAILGAVAFAVVGAGVSLVIARYLPELKKLSDAEDRSDARQPGGRNVDIVIPQEEPGIYSDDEESSEGPESGELDGEESVDEFAGDSLVEEVEELASDDSILPGEGSQRAAGGEGPVTRRSAPSDVVGEEESRELLDADTKNLPDIGGLAGSFDGESVGSIVEPEETREEVRGGRDDMDPETIARALRTVLKRDQS